MLTDAPHLAQHHGRIVGVGFEQGRTEVRIRTDDGRTIAWTATPEQMEKALVLRGVQITALGVAAAEGSPQWLILRKLNELSPRSSRKAVMYERWDGLLRRLAQ